MQSKAAKMISKIVLDKPISVDTKFEKLERDTHRRLDHVEENLDMFKDIVLKLHEEREKIRKENIWLKHKLGKLARPIVEEGREIAQLMTADLHPDGAAAEAAAEAQASSASGRRPHENPDTNIGKGSEQTKAGVVWSKKKDPQVKTVKWLRTKFGLAPTPGKKIMPHGKNN
jgi:hypothetical protein